MTDLNALAERLESQANYIENVNPEDLRAAADYIRRGEKARVIWGSPARITYILQDGGYVARSAPGAGA